jgi:hypothetical protein
LRTLRSPQPYAFFLLCVCVCVCTSVGMCMCGVCMCMYVCMRTSCSSLSLPVCINIIYSSGLSALCLTTPSAAAAQHLRRAEAAPHALCTLHSDLSSVCGRGALLPSGASVIISLERGVPPDLYRTNLSCVSPRTPCGSGTLMRSARDQHCGGMRSLSPLSPSFLHAPILSPLSALACPPR